MERFIQFFYLQRNEKIDVIKDYHLFIGGFIGQFYIVELLLSEPCGQTFV
jgi:hypothetical protein